MATIIMAAGWENQIKVRSVPFVHRTARAIGRDVQANIVESGLVRTGELLGSVSVTGNKVFIGAHHWVYLEYGTSPHVITARPGSALYSAERNFGPAQRVVHPGNRAYAPIRRAVYKRRAMRML